MRYVNGDILKQGNDIIMIDFPRRNKKGTTSKIEFKVYIIDKLDLENDIVKKGREIEYFNMCGEWELIERTRPELFDKNIKHPYKVGQLLEIKGYITETYEIIKIEDEMIYLTNYDSLQYDYRDYTIGELKESKFNLIGMKPEPKIESLEEVRRRAYYLAQREMEERRKREEEIEWRNKSYYPRLGDMDSFGNY